MDINEIEKSKPYLIIEIVEYVPNSIVSRTIIRKTTGNISVVAIDCGEELVEKISPFDTFIQIIEGMAEIVMDKKTTILQSGEGIIIPAHQANIVKATNRFKMISTIIKSGYENGVT